MDYVIPEKSTLFRGVPAKELRDILHDTPQQIRRYDKDETVFHLTAPAERVGIVLEGHAQAQRSFPNGSQVNVSVRGPGALIGAAAVFSTAQRYPCEVVALDPVTVLMFKKEDLLHLMQKDLRIMENFVTEISSAACMLQQRLELFSYSGIAQKAAFWLLTRRRQTGNDRVRIPGSMTEWALLMNVSRPSLHRELKQLVDLGILAYAPPVITILDPAALQDVLGR